MTLQHRASRIIDQRPDVVHARLLELAARLRDEAPPIAPGTQTASLLGITGPIGITLDDRGANRIEMRTTEGRIRGEVAVDLEPTADGKTNLAIDVAVKPQGFAANVMLGAALKMMPGIEQQVIHGAEAMLDDLSVELAKSDAEWDASAWLPPGLPTRR
jgi:hypothetical protein